MKKNIYYKGWLNELKMTAVITEVVNELKGELLECGYKKGKNKYKEGTQIKLPDSRSHFDFGFIYNETKYLVEFDGNYQGVGHYNNAENCYKDDKKNELAHKYGYKLIRFPYWLQLNNITFNILFGFDCGCNIVNDFPNGFITNSSLNPASFCKLGLERFNIEIDKLSEELRFEIFVSIKVKSDRLNIPIKYIWDDNRIVEIQSAFNYNEIYNKIKLFVDNWNSRGNNNWN